MASGGDISRENGKKGGRPKGYASIAAENFRAALCKEIEKEAAEYVKAWKALALGHWVEVKDENGNPVSIYKKSPDNSALRDLTNRAFGKPEQPIEHSGDIGSYDLTVDERKDLMLFEHYEEGEDGTLSETDGETGDTESLVQK